jgi:hypothetical protein
MNLTRMGLGVVTVWLALTAAAAPVPDRLPESQGPITDFLRQRDRFPSTAAPRVLRLQGDDGTAFEIERMATRSIATTRMVEVDQAGRKVAVATTVYVPVFESYKQKVAVKDCTIFTVTTGGKLEATELKKLLPRLRKPVAVLIGESAEVDPRHLELVESGTLYMVLPPGRPLRMPAEPLVPREEKEKD